jgi:hypothetical protein
MCCCLLLVINSVTEATKATMRQQLLIYLSLKRGNGRVLNRRARRRALASRRPARSPSYLHTGTVGSTICKEMPVENVSRVVDAVFLGFSTSPLPTARICLYRAPADSKETFRMTYVACVLDAISVNGFI